MATKKKDSSGKGTPLMKQYNQIKGKHPNALLLFRVGDFYETFGKDAVVASKILGIVLTARNNGSSKIELAGFPHHSLESYLPKLVRAGQRVAICDQLEDPKTTKKIVKRGVTELVTPGVAFSDQVLDTKSNNFLAAVHTNKKMAGVSFLDISTGEFLVAQGTPDYVSKLLHGFKPAEILFQKQKEKEFTNLFGNGFNTFKMEDWAFTEDFAKDLLLNHFKTKSLKGFGVETLDAGIIAAGVVLHYLGETQHDKTGHISKISRIEQDKHAWLDQFTVNSLELTHSANQNATTLIDILDQTSSPMGARLLKRWIVLPLKDQEKICERHNVVDHLLNNDELTAEIQQHLSQIGDIERLISKVAAMRINPRELLQLKRSIESTIPIKTTCTQKEHQPLHKLGKQLHGCESLHQIISEKIHEDPPVAIGKGKVIADNVSEELDELRTIAFSGKDYLVQIQQRESERTGIPSLKIGFNNVFGYYLEVRNSHKDKVPEEWVRKQTLTQAERYITEELKEYEQKILTAEEKIVELENRLYTDVILSLANFIAPIQQNATIIAQLDCLHSFARTAKENRYVRPIISDSKVLEIHKGRHPVIEKCLEVGTEYVANDVRLAPEDQQIIMITGPNMSGKSALLRQTALIVLMAQMGSFIPAEQAEIGIVDKIFTRVGASDNISSGESTFMVEMNETANILNNISDRSLILLDEIGRGTSTYDGISIAWSIAEYIHEHPKVKAKTLFATHYHELNEMNSTFGRIKNYNVAVKEANGKIHFLRKLVPGGSEHSFGIHVAKMAGMPTKILKRAEEILETLENSRNKKEDKKKIKDVAKTAGMQLSFFELEDPALVEIREQITSIDINTLTPVEALMKLNEIKKLTGV